MHFTFLFVDKTRSPIWQATEAEYLERLSRFVKYSIKIIPPVKNKTAAECIIQESKNLLADKSARDCFLVALDKSGHSLSSEGLSEKLSLLQNNHSEIAFIIGGAFGLSGGLLEKADFVWSLSPLTFTHEMARTIIFEQLYRAFTINKNLPYHY
ncbi:23S rRNA (pseudouridine(1915)-N(3))-methyltransferase RlmH [Candidatus Kuenenbacteria bacterium]|nr:23S rRNA (pseudouridine(1915)-N(3))-methyltransferase RlmH [Candidatus Kuenenbacteria bacterium]